MRDMKVYMVAKVERQVGTFPETSKDTALGFLGPRVLHSESCSCIAIDLKRKEELLEHKRFAPYKKGTFPFFYLSEATISAAFIVP